MSLLIALRQRIKVVETIKKTTNAMRLISMSTHSRLRQKKSFLDTYQQEIARLTALVKHMATSTLHINSTLENKNQELIIVIGSQKGLCGNFNSSLAKFFEETMLPLNQNQTVVAIGKQIIDFLKARNVEIYTRYPYFSSQNFVAIAHELADKILTNFSYRQVTVVSNHPKTFFIRLIQKTIVFPVQETVSVPQQVSEPIIAQPITYDPTMYLWEKTPEEMLEYLTSLYIKAHLEMILFESLLAEQAARFITMDASTHNADNLLVTMRLNYNKLRQTVITRELTDLTSSL